MLAAALILPACGMGGAAPRTAIHSPPTGGPATAAPTTSRTGAPQATPTGGWLLPGLPPQSASPVTEDPPAAAPAAATPDRSDPSVVARAYATGLFTVDWTRPRPTGQKVAATRPWATPALTAKLAHGQDYQPDISDPRVAAGEVDSVDQVVLADTDPVPGAESYFATVHLSSRSAAGSTATEAFLLLRVVRTDDGWLVEDVRFV